MKKGKDSFYAKYIKRLLDFTFSLIALVVLSPLQLILIITGTIAMKGNPFFIQKRPGKIDKKTGKEKIFSLIKFRTMDDRRDNNGDLLPDEVRLNGYGKFLRKLSLDELPELLNILIGEMAFVGPRPLLVKYLPLYSDKQHHRHDVRPGLTGYAQVHGRNTVSWEDKFAMDFWYTANVSFKFDFQIILETVKAVLKRDGISSDTSATMEEFTGTDEKADVKWEAPV